MKDSFKPLALAAAVAALSAGSVGVVNAQAPAGIYPSMGDAAFVPYYTVQGDWVTGVHITNTSDYTQVIKLRLRRAEDSLDILDFNLILSPFDMWTGTIKGDETAMEFVSEDVSCTAPALIGGTVAPISGDRLTGAQEGYLEVIGMGQADSDQAISIAALHSNGVPNNCDRVRENFFVANIVDNDETEQDNGATSGYMSTGNVLKVSYFIRDNASGIEFGNNAVHFTNFNQEAMMTHQQFGLESYAAQGSPALYGWDFPDVRGGSSLNSFSPGRQSFPQSVRPQLGADRLINDWSYNPATGASTDWTVTFPGQYAMVDFYQLEEELLGNSDAFWDYREIPVIATFAVYDREENTGIPGGLNFSPSPAPDAAFLPNEVNVVTWGTGPDVLDSEFATNVNPADAGVVSPKGWAALSVTATNTGNGWAWCDVADGPNGTPVVIGEACEMYTTSGPVPMVGFATWERTFDDPNLNYGRIVEHSFNTNFAP